MFFPQEDDPTNRHAQFILIHEATASMGGNSDCEMFGSLSWVGVSDHVSASRLRWITVVPTITCVSDTVSLEGDLYVASAPRCSSKRFFTRSLSWAVRKRWVYRMSAYFAADEDVTSEPLAVNNWHQRNTSLRLNSQGLPCWPYIFISTTSCCIPQLMSTILVTNDMGTEGNWSDTMLRRSSLVNAST